MATNVAGHGLPGFFFLFYGYLGAYLCIRRYLTCLKSGQQFQANVAFDLSVTIRNRVYPLEGIMRAFLSSVGIFYEMLKYMPDFHPHSSFVHSLMYSPYLLSGLVEVLLFYGYPLPSGSDYIFAIFAFCNQAVLNIGHLHGRSLVDVHMHMLAVTAALLCALVLSLELRFNHSPVLSLSRCFLLSVQGSWLIQIGHIMDSPAWTMDSQEESTAAFMYFSGHCILHSILMLIMVLLMGRHQSSFKELNTNFSGKGMNSDEYRIQNFHDDSNDDNSYAAWETADHDKLLRRDSKL